MRMVDKTTDQYRELACRAFDGVEVVLFWNETTDELAVAVSDEHSGSSFELAADPREALDVFNHPYAHAAWAHHAEARAFTRGDDEQ
jgi:hypothetical protein